MSWWSRRSTIIAELSAVGQPDSAISSAALASELGSAVQKPLARSEAPQLQPAKPTASAKLPPTPTATLSSGISIPTVQASSHWASCSSLLSTSLSELQPTLTACLPHCRASYSCVAPPLLRTRQGGTVWHLRRFRQCPLRQCRRRRRHRRVLHRARSDTGRVRSALRVIQMQSSC